MMLPLVTDIRTPSFVGRPISKRSTQQGSFKTTSSVHIVTECLDVVFSMLTLRIIIYMLCNNNEHVDYCSICRSRLLQSRYHSKGYRQGVDIMR